MSKEPDLLNKEPSEDLRIARRILEDVKGYECLSDFYWENRLKKWVLHVRLTINSSDNKLIPTSTEWRIAISENYPNEDILFLPDANSGIKHTFPHQNFNKAVDDANWRMGKICLASSQGSWGRKKYSKEPVESKLRLKWNIERCISWLNAAAAGSLIEDGDPFELPDFPSESGYRIVFNEDDNTFSKWSNEDTKAGLANFRSLNHSAETFAITRFQDVNSVDYNSLGPYLNYIKSEEKDGMWIMLNKIPVLPPWQIPEKFIELITLCHQQGIDLVGMITSANNELKKLKKTLSVVFLGFPVPIRFGEPNRLIHWFAFKLHQQTTSKGFRKNNTAWKHQVLLALSPSKSIKWIKTENWNKRQLTNRGSLSSKISHSKILLIGAGSLGSVFIECFARLACSKITVLDFDKLQAGNLSRHTLTLESVGMNKAEALSKRLNSTFPFIESISVNSKLQELLSNNPRYLENFDIVIDATAEDEVINVISGVLPQSSFFFVSVSCGYNADRLYCYTRPSSLKRISLHNDFNNKLEKWVVKDTIAANLGEEVIDGIGCWHPLFPARFDDIQMLAGAAFKLFEKQFNSQESQLAVVEKKYDEAGNFIGLNVLKE